MLEYLKAKRLKINNQIAWACVVPPLGWFGRLRRLDGRHAVVSLQIRQELRQLRDAA